MVTRTTWAALGKGVALLVLLGFAVVVAASPGCQEDVAEGVRALTRVGESPRAMVAFVALYALAIALGVPGTALTLIGGVAFGPARGFALNMLGALVGSAAAFYEGRFLARGFAERFLGHRLARLDGLSEFGRAFITIVRLRLMPLLPFAAVNFSAGLTRASFWAYLFGTAVGILPSTLLFTVFAGKLAESSAAARESAMFWVAVGLFALFLLSYAPNLWRALRNRSQTS